MIDTILGQLDKVRPSGNGKYMARCPSHEDRDPSLAIAETDDGRILLHCFAGCSADEVLGSIGLTLSDLYPDGAVRDQLKGWATMTKRKPTINDETDGYTIEIAKRRRAHGEQLSPQDREAERNAWMRARNANNHG